MLCSRQTFVFAESATGSFVFRSGGGGQILKALHRKTGRRAMRRILGLTSPTRFKNKVISAISGPAFSPYVALDYFVRQFERSFFQENLLMIRGF
jgi:hypothetical protein